MPGSHHSHERLLDEGGTDETHDERAAAEAMADVAIDIAQKKSQAGPSNTPLSDAGSFLIHVPSSSQMQRSSVSEARSDTEEFSDAEQPLLEPASLTAAPAPAERKDNVPVGMLWYGLSSFFFTGMGICSKLLGEQGYPVWEITLFRAVIIMSLSLSVLFSQGENPLGNRRGLLFMRGTFGYGSITCYFLACQLLPLADATTFTFLGPLLVACFSPLILNERPSSAVIAVIPLCLGGVLLITRPSFLFGHGSGLPWLGIIFGLAQPIFSASAKMAVRMLRTTEKTNVMVFYLMACTLLYSTLGCIFTWKSLVLPSTLPQIALLIGQGLFGYGNQICITKGLANARAASVMCMQYFSIVISQAAGMLLFREFTTWKGDIGMVLIVISMVVFLWHEAARK